MLLDRRSLLSMPLAALAQPAPREIRLISVAPSPYTQRRDSFRAGAGILLSIRRLAKEHSFNIRATYFDAAPHLERTEKLRSMLRGMHVLMVGGSTWAQGTAAPMRRFLEQVNSEPLEGVMASAWVTSGGAHTGGEMAHESTLNTLRGMGASVFTFGQKQMVFSTDERFGQEKEGDFTLLDCWFMESFAKAAIVAALTPGDPEGARAMWKKLESSPAYWHGYFPKNEESLRPRLAELRALLNAAAKPRSTERKQLDALLEP